MYKINNQTKIQTFTKTFVVFENKVAFRFVDILPDVVFYHEEYTQKEIKEVINVKGIKLFIKVSSNAFDQIVTPISKITKGTADTSFYYHNANVAYDGKDILTNVWMSGNYQNPYGDGSYFPIHYKLKPEQVDRYINDKLEGRKEMQEVQYCRDAKVTLGNFIRETGERLSIMHHLIYKGIIYKKHGIKAGNNIVNKLNKLRLIRIHNEAWINNIRRLTYDK